MNKSGIYKITNQINGKIYIGSTVNLTRRWWSHRTITNKGCKKLNAALQKYGVDSFNIELIESIPCPDGLTKEVQHVLWEREQHYLDKLEPFDNKGYNLIRTANNGHQQVGSHCHNHNKPVSQFALNGVWIKDYDSMKEAANDNNMIDTSITDCIRGRKKSAGGFMWRLQTHERQIPPYKSNVMKPITQLTLDGQIIRHWESCYAASRETGVNKGNINSCCVGRYQTAGGYRWAYSNE